LYIDPRHTVRSWHDWLSLIIAACTLIGLIVHAILQVYDVEVKIYAPIKNLYIQVELLNRKIDSMEQRVDGLGNRCAKLEESQHGKK
jgi:hypothetical protein